MNSVGKRSAPSTPSCNARGIARVAAALALATGLALLAGESFAGGKVVVYSPHGDEILNAVSEAFTKQTGISVEFLTAGGGELVDRVRAESANPVADVMYGNPSSVFMEMKNQGLLQAYTPSWAADLDPYFKDAEGFWAGTIQTPVVIFYNSEMLTADQAPKDWSDLADPKYKDQIILRSTTSAASRAAFASLAYQFDKQGTLETDGWNFFRAFDQNTKRYVYDSGLMFQGIGRMEGAVSFWTLDGVSTNQTKNNLPLTIVNATSGSPVITDAIGIIAGAKDPENAKKFIDFAGSEANQILLANQFNRMPTLKSALAQSPGWMTKFEYKIMDVDWGRLAVKQSEWIQYIEDNIRDSGKVEQQ